MSRRIPVVRRPSPVPGEWDIQCKLSVDDQRGFRGWWRSLLRLSPRIELIIVEGDVPFELLPHLFVELHE